MQWKRNLLFLSIAVFLANIAFTLTFPFMPRFLEELGVKENLSLWSGIMVSFNFLTYAIMAPIWGAIADKRGKRNMFLRSGIGIAISYILMGLVANHWQLLLLRGLNGLLSGFIPAAIMLVASNTSDLEIGYALGILNTFIALGSIIGPFLGGSIVQYMGIPTTFFISAGILCFATMLAFFGTKEKVFAKSKKKTAIWQDLKIIMVNRSLMVYFFCMIMLQTAIFMIQPILPIRIAELTTKNVDFITGLIFSVIGISLAIGSPLVSRIKKFSYSIILFNGLIMCAVFSFLQGFTYSIVLLGAERFLFGFANAAVNVSGNVLITQCASEDMRGRVFGTLNGLTALGAVFGPLLGGFLGEQFGTASSFHGSGFMFIFAVFAVWSIRNMPIEKIKESGSLG